VTVTNDLPKVSAYIEAGAPTQCFLPSCHKPFDGYTVHGEDGHYYCSLECAETGRKVDLSRVEELRPKAIPTPQQKISIGKWG
jgi:hypothetical protein